MGKNSFFCILIISIFILNGCSNSSELMPDSKKGTLMNFSNELNELMNIVNEEHKSIIKPEIQYEKYIQNSQSALEYNPVESVSADGNLSFEQMENDINVLFYNLQSNYGLYIYFGGDEVFMRAKESIIQKCLEKNELSKDAFAEVIKQNLSFVKDGHFSLNGEPLAKSVFSFIYNNTEFEKTEMGYFNKVTKQKLIEVEGFNLDEVMKRALSETGEVVYYPITFQEYYITEYKTQAEVKSDDLILHYSDGGTQVLPGVSRKATYSNEKPQVVDMHENEGIPVVSVLEMGFDMSQSGSGGKFLSYADLLKNEPVMILDLRKNGGGNSVLPYEWMEAYTGQKVSTNFYTLLHERLTDTQKNGIYNSLTFEKMTNILGAKNLEGNYSITNTIEDIFAENDKLLIILTGKNTWSAAEVLVDIAHNVENTLIIGENTAGALQGNMAHEAFKLPCSHIPVHFGNGLNVFPDNQNYFQEFMGFQPDIWVSSKEAEELAVKYINNMMNK